MTNPLSTKDKSSSKDTQDALNLVWLDLEMTGLDPARERIIEAMMVVTDKDLNILAESETYVIHQADSLLDTMDAWNTKTHTRTGLIERVRASKLTEEAAEDAMLAFVSAWIPPGKAPLCGNSIHQDRRFLQKYMPRLEAYFHYRNIDVSTIKELAKRWRPEVLLGLTKKGAHQAREDILESIDEMRYYKEHFFKLED